MITKVIQSCSKGAIFSDFSTETCMSKLAITPNPGTLLQILGLLQTLGTLLHTLGVPPPCLPKSNVFS